MFVAVFSLLTTSLSYNPQEAYATSHLTYADEVVSATINHSDATRLDPNAAKGPEDHTSGNSGAFVALGFHGSITLGYDQPVGGILTVFETTNGGWPVEKVKVEVSTDGNSWDFVGTATNENSIPGENPNIRVSTFDLEEEGIVGCVSFVRLTDETETFSSTKPGPDYFDVDAVGISGNVECIPPLEVCEDDVSILYAGQDIDAGFVTINDDGTDLTITIQTENGWSLSETHISVQTTEADIPQNKKGNPKVGHFEYSESHDPNVEFYELVISLDDLTVNGDGTLTIAVHAVVQQIVNDEVVAEETAWKDGVNRFVDKGNWATYNIYPICDLIE